MNLLYPELSYKLVGIAYKVFNDFGYGYPEKHYQQVFEKLLQKEKITFIREQLVKVSYEGQPLEKYFLDFIVDKTIVVELKVRPSLGYTHIKQVMGYLKSCKCKLAILIYFTRDGVKYRRIINSN